MAKNLETVVSNAKPAQDSPIVQNNRVETRISSPSQLPASIAPRVTPEKTQITVRKSSHASQPVQGEEPEDETILGMIAAQPTPETKAAAAWFEQAQELAQRQHYAEALAACDRACQLCPTNADFWHWQGNLLVTMEQYAKAIAAYSKATPLTPENVELWHRMGTVLTRLQRYQEAVACFNRAIKLRPNSADFWYCRARALCQLKEYAKAIQSFDRALQIKPGFQLALRDRQQLLNQLRPPVIKSTQLKVPT